MYHLSYWAPIAVSSSEMALALSKFQHMAPDGGPRVQASLMEYAHFGDARLGMGTIVIAGTAGAVANHGSHQPSFHTSNDDWKARLLMHLIIGRFIEPASWGENLRFLQLDSGPDPDFGRLTYIGAPPPRDTIILLAQVGYCHLLSREVPHNSQRKPSASSHAGGVPHDTAIRPFTADT